VVNGTWLGYTGYSVMKEAIKEGSAKLIKHQKVRFGLVGIINTAVDFIILNVLVGVFNVPLVPSNIVSTTAAMLTSFTLNKKAVFRGNKGNNAKQLLLFVVVTFTGIWLVQSTVLAVVYHFLQSTGLNSTLLLNISKLAGIGVGLIWNYFGYSRIVFKEKSDEKDS
jgi:putative flippase GtrA